MYKRSRLCNVTVLFDILTILTELIFAISYNLELYVTGLYVTYVTVAFQTCQRLK